LISSDYAWLSSRDEQAMQMPEDPASLVNIAPKILLFSFCSPLQGQQQEGGLLKGIFS
jgi:hypothetical protein